MSRQRIIVTGTLPKSVTKQLKKAGVPVRSQGEMPIYEVLDNVAAHLIIKQFMADHDKCDPIVNATFGPPMHPFVDAATQRDILSLLATYQPLLAADLLGLINFQQVQQAPPGGFQFHHSQIATWAVVEEIQTAQYFALESILAVPTGNVIVDISLTYKNLVVVLRLHRS